MTTLRRSPWQQKVSKSDCRHTFLPVRARTGSTNKQIPAKQEILKEARLREQILKAAERNTMALIPNFDRIVATITQADIDKFYKSTATDADKQQVREASTLELQMRFVAGYMIRTNQILPSRLNPKAAKAPVKSSRATKSAATAKTKAAASLEANPL
jgi:hypothetical protein